MFKRSSASTKAAQKPADKTLTNAETLQIFLNSMQSLEAFNLKKKYELGKLISNIIKNSNFVDPSEVKPTKADENKAAGEKDVIDKNPEESWRLTESFMNAYKDKGWDDIKNSLRNEPAYVRAKMVVRAITEEQVDLVKALLQGRYSYATVERFNYALKVYKERGTTQAEEIIDFIEKNNPELGTAVNLNDKLNLGLAYLKVHEYIFANNYPMLRRALEEGFNPNFVFEKRGSLLGLSVIARCTRCVKILIEHGADVNYPILLNEVVDAKAWGRSVIPQGWTPLMMAVADGQVRIIKEIIESGSAEVSKTAQGQEAERFHAREVARRIKNEDLREQILNSLILSFSERQRIKLAVAGKDFINSIKMRDASALDSFLLLRPLKEIAIPDEIPLDDDEISQSMQTILHQEMIEFGEDK